MTRYAAFLRGINAGVNVRMEDLRRVFESLGFKHVQTVISSGNVLFETGSVDVSSLERRIEVALEKKLGLKSSVNIRTEEELKAIVASNPFRNTETAPNTKPYVTFLKDEPRTDPRSPFTRHEKGYAVLRIADRVIFSIVDLSSGTTPDLMAVLDKEFGKKITTRAWNTIERVLRRWGGSNSAAPAGKDIDRTSH